MLTMQNGISGEPLGMGPGWFLGTDGAVGYAEHIGGGPGILSVFRIYPQKHLAPAVFANFTDYSPGLILNSPTRLLPE